MGSLHRWRKGSEMPREWQNRTHMSCQVAAAAWARPATTWWAAEAVARRKSRRKALRVQAGRAAKVRSVGMWNQNGQAIVSW